MFCPVANEKKIGKIFKADHDGYVSQVNERSDEGTIFFNHTGQHVRRRQTHPYVKEPQLYAPISSSHCSSLERTQ